MSRRYDPHRLRTQLRAIHLSQVYRVIHSRYAKTPLGAVPTPSRFSDPQKQYALLYALEAVRCSFWEAVVRQRLTYRTHRTIAYSDVAQRWIVALHSTATLLLIDLRDDGPIRIGAPTAVAHDARHHAGRALSAAVHAHLPEADGFLYTSRFTGHACVAVFDRAFDRLAVLASMPLIEHTDFLDALDDYEIQLTLPPGG